MYSVDGTNSPRLSPPQFDPGRTPSGKYAYSSSLYHLIVGFVKVVWDGTERKPLQQKIELASVRVTPERLTTVDGESGVLCVEAIHLLKRRCLRF